MVLLEITQVFSNKQEGGFSKYQKEYCPFSISAEDGIQLFLEYFYISKYFTNLPRIFLIYRDIVAALLAICVIQLNLKEVFNETDKFRRILFGVLVLIGITELLRMFAVIDQCIDLKLHRDCFNVFYRHHLTLVL